MSAWDEADARASAAVARALNEPVEWRPYLPAGGGGGYTTGSSSAQPDPNRPVRPIEGIITWRPTLGAVEPGAGGGTVASAMLVVDFDMALFPTVPERPRKGDRLFLPNEPIPQDRLVEITRVADDGSARLLCYCSRVKA
jgi:hypothetical protein